MKRFHVHLHVDDVAKSVGFYSKLFATEPARLEGDCAKWMLADPPVNFAISTRGAHPGIDHLGIQTDDPAELAAMKARVEAADMALLDEGETTCCYARANCPTGSLSRREAGVAPGGVAIVPAASVRETATEVARLTLPPADLRRDGRPGTERTGRRDAAVGDGDGGQRRC